MSLNTCLAGLEAQAVLEVLVLNLLMKTFLKQSVTIKNTAKRLSSKNSLKLLKVVCLIILHAAVMSYLPGRPGGPGGPGGPGSAETPTEPNCPKNENKNTQFYLKNSM